MLCELQQAVSENKCKVIHGNETSSMLICVARARIAKVYNRKVSDDSNLKTLSPKQMLYRLPIALAHVKPGNTSENLINEIRQTIYFLYRAKKLLKKYITIP